MGWWTIVSNNHRNNFLLDFKKCNRKPNTIPIRQGMIIKAIITIIIMVNQLTNGAALTGIFHRFKQNSNKDFVSILESLNNHHNFLNKDNTVIESLFTNASTKTKFKDDVATLIKEDFLKYCIKLVKAGKPADQNIVNEVFNNLSMFYRVKGGYYFQIFDADQVIHAMSTLEDRNRDPSHDPYPGALVIYYSVDTLFVPYKDLPYNGLPFQKLSTKTPSASTTSTSLAKKASANIKDSLKGLCQITEKSSNAWSSSVIFNQNALPKEV